MSLTIEGWLLKRGVRTFGKGWKRRYFQFKDSSGTCNRPFTQLTYSKAVLDRTPRGCIPLAKVLLVEKNSDVHFTIYIEDRGYELEAQNSQSADSWVAAVKEACAATLRKPELPSVVPALEQGPFEAGSPAQSQKPVEFDRAPSAAASSFSSAGISLQRPHEDWQSLTPSRSLSNTESLPHTTQGTASAASSPLSSASPRHPTSPSRNHATAQAQAARADVGSTTEAMQDALKKTREREEKIRKFQEQANELKEAAQELRSQSASYRAEQTRCSLL